MQTEPMQQTQTCAQDPALRFRLLDKRAAVPARHSAGAAGLDLAACLPRGPIEAASFVLERGRIAAIPTGVAMAVNPGWEGQIRARSGLAIRSGIAVPNAPGTIDADYRGELLVGLINLGPEPFEIAHGMRIAQLVIAPVWAGEPEIVADLDATARGTGGFGSSGV